jgi:hypothetical protein
MGVAGANHDLFGRCFANKLDLDYRLTLSDDLEDVSGRVRC